MWEAQFGDFANGAQVIIDQFICSGESKWLRMNGLVMLLPHGYEGQGPEHSARRASSAICSSRAEDNMQVCIPTTPANYFHALRRQMRRNFRKPLIVMTPKSLLRHKECVSTLADMGPGTSFRRILAETDQLVDGRRRSAASCCAAARSTSISWPSAASARSTTSPSCASSSSIPSRSRGWASGCRNIRNAEVVWCQEEPENMGAWQFVDRRIERALVDASTSRRSVRSMSAARKQRRRPPARRAPI